MAVTSSDEPRSTLVRSSAKTAAIRRGEIKISSPIALLSEEHGSLNDAFPTAGTLTTHHTTEIIHVEPRRSVDVQIVGGPADSLRGDRTAPPSSRPSREVPRVLQRQNTAMLRKGSFLARRESNNRPQAPPEPDQFHGQSAIEPIKRRKSNGLRTVLRKMFGKKEKERDKPREEQPEISVISRPESLKPSSIRHNYHRSVCSLHTLKTMGNSSIAFDGLHLFGYNLGKR